MFKKIVLALFLCVVLNPVVIAQECCEHSLINTEASINNEIEPDTAKIRFSVQNSGLNLDSIKEKNDKTVSDAINAIKANLNANESIKTTSFNVRNIYSYKDKVRVFQKYEVTNSFEVKIKDLTKISKIINLAMASGVKNVNGVDFLIEKLSFLISDAIKSDANMNGEFVIVVSPSNEEISTDMSIIENVDFYIRSGLSSMDAIKMVAKERKLPKNFKLRIYGDGPLKEMLEHLINEFKLNDKIFLMGKVMNPYKYLKDSDLFILWSFFERRRACYDSAMDRFILCKGRILLVVERWLR